MSDSILNSTKKILGIEQDNTAFDVDILTHINTVFSTLGQLDIGPESGFTIADATPTWDAFLGDDPRLNIAKAYVYLRVRLLFDPPTMSHIIEPMNKQVEELEWRLKVLDELYFKWLYSQVCSTRARNPSRSYRTLLNQLFTKEFVWIIPYDDNRAEDGRALRAEFLNSRRIDVVDPSWLRLGCCSMLEMLIGMSRRLSWEIDEEPRDCFWQLIENLDLGAYNDNTQISEEGIDKILDRVIWRTYEPDGNGGLFPLKKAVKDQRNIQLWDQLGAYVIEGLERKEGG